MPAARSRLALLALAAWATAAPAGEPSAAAQKLTKKLADAQKAFDAAQKKAKKDLVTALKEAEAAAPRLQPGPLGAAHQKAIRAEREAFERSDALPAGDETAAGVFAYLASVHQARPKVRQVHDSLVQQLGKDGDAAGAAKAKADLAAFDAAAPGAAGLAAGSKWGGTLRQPNFNNDIQFVIDQLDDKTLAGVVSTDRGGRRLKVEGVRSGPYFELRTVKVLRGADQFPVFRGVVTDKRMLLEVAGLAGRKGTTFSGVGELTRR